VLVCFEITQSFMLCYMCYTLQLEGAVQPSQVYMHMYRWWRC